MDRGHRSWPGGPVPAAPYPHERFGGKYPPHEVDAREPFEIVRTLADLVPDETKPMQADVQARVTVPDPRLVMTLAVFFAPDVPGDAYPVYWWAGGTAFVPTIHLCSVVDSGVGPLPVEDLLGTYGAGVSLVAEGLCGLLYSPTEDVEAMAASIRLLSPNVAMSGRWLVRARWGQLRPMSEIDWRAAVAKCKVEVSGQTVMTNVAGS